MATLGRTKIATPKSNKISQLSSLDFGEYAVSIANYRKTSSLLWECFNSEDAARIYGLVLSHFIQGFTYLKDVKDYYDMSVLSLAYPSLKMGYSSLSSLYETLLGEGREACCVWRRSSLP